MYIVSNVLSRLYTHKEVHIPGAFVSFVRNISNIGQLEDADATLAAPESFSAEFNI